MFWPDGKTAYVEALGGYYGNITPIVTATNTPGPRIGAGHKPFAMAITPDGTTAYVTSYESGTVTPIATATNTPGTPIKVGKRAYAVAIAP